MSPDNDLVNTNLNSFMHLYEVLSKNAFGKIAALSLDHKGTQKCTRSLHSKKAYQQKRVSKHSFFECCPLSSKFGIMNHSACEI